MRTSRSLKTNLPSVSVTQRLAEVPVIHRGVKMELVLPPHGGDRHLGSEDGALEGVGDFAFENAG